MNKSKEMTKIACEAIEDKLGKDIKVIDISNVSIVADYFIIATGSNQNQVQAIVDNVEDELGKAGHEKKQMEGYKAGGWVLMDFNDIIIHIFSEEERIFYDLERIWRDGKDVDPKDL